MHRIRLALLLTFPLISFSPQVRASDSAVFYDEDIDEDDFRNLEVRVIDGSISGFKIYKEKSQVYLTETDDIEPQPTLAIRCNLRGAQQKTLILNRKFKGRPNANGDYLFEVPIAKDDIIALFEVKEGNVTKEWARFKFTTTGVSESYRGVRVKKVPGRFALSAGAGVTTSTYTQTRVGSISMFALTGKVSARWAKRGSPWGIFGNTFVTAFNISSNPSTRQLQFLGSNIRGTYSIPFEKSRWAMSISTGLYFNTTFGMTGNFGYQNIMGPQLYPSVRFVDKAWNVWMAYFKFSPVSSRLSLMDSSGSRELGAGITYALKPDKKRQYFAFSFDWSDLKVTLGSSQFTVKQMTLGASYQL